MNLPLAFVILVFSVAFGAAAPAIAQDAAPTAEELVEIIMPGDSISLDELVWIKRPLIVFADSPADPRYVQQMEYITDRAKDLEERDVVVLTDTAKGEDTALRKKLRPRGFMLVLIGKDGTVYLRKPLPWDVREISRVIDKMPMRQQEMRDRRGDS